MSSCVFTRRFTKKHILILLLFLAGHTVSAQQTIAPTREQVNRPFSSKDETKFAEPDEICYPETWFHFVDGNVEKEGITKDLEAIKDAGIRGVQFFHGGSFGGTWPGVEDPVYCLSDRWTDILKYTAGEAGRLGLRFTMQVCPGWSMAGGPWIKKENAMRGIVHSRTDIKGGNKVILNLQQSEGTQDADRDYRDICVLAFPRPSGDSPEEDAIYKLEEPIKLPKEPWTLDIDIPQPSAVRSLEISNASAMSQAYAYEPACKIKVEAWLENGEKESVLDAPVTMSAWQVPTPTMTFALKEVKASKVRITITHSHPVTLGVLKLSGASRKNGWEMQAGKVLYGIPHVSEFIEQSKDSYIQEGGVIDISEKMDPSGRLEWEAPAGEWCILRIGHVNTCKKNGPAPAEAVGWECDKLTAEGADAVFDGYVGKYEKETVHGLVSGMLMDSWECETQTWCRGMERIFEEKMGYPLKAHLPALFGYVIEDQRHTAKFLLDYRSLVNNMIVENFYGRMAQRAHQRGMYVQYETSGGDVYPCDPMEYFKYADVPMAEFWHHSTSDNYVGSINFKPVRPTASAGHIYGKTRISAEAFTSFWLTWDEHFWQLKENANRHMAQGITHEVFHTYTHNPKADTMVPGTSFGSNIGTPFLRGQTWWKYMPQFTKYLARCTYMLERGVPSMDVLWYLGDDMDHKPDQRPDYMPGFNYDYCNRDALLHRISVKNGRIVTPEGLTYSVIWWPVADVVSPETLEAMLSLVREGAVLVTTRPRDVSTLRRYDTAWFNAAFAQLYGDTVASAPRKVGKGKVYLDVPIMAALLAEGLQEDVMCSEGVDWLHRRIEGADWYFVAPKEGKGFKGSVDFRCKGDVQVWNPVDGSVIKADAYSEGGRTKVSLFLERAECCFVVFRHKTTSTESKRPTESDVFRTIDISKSWQLSFPEGWGAPHKLSLDVLVPWKDIEMSAEGQAFSGTAVYTRTFELEGVREHSGCILDLGSVDMVADVSVNGKHFEPLWTSPYIVDISSAIKEGTNELRIEVTGTWFNRLVFDAGQKEKDRKTWTIAGPSSDEPLRPVGLLGPVQMIRY